MSYRWLILRKAFEFFRLARALPNDHDINISDARFSGVNFPRESEPLFEVYEDKAGGFRFRLKAPNHLIIAAGESYENLNGCINGVEVVKRIAADAPI